MRSYASDITISPNSFIDLQTHTHLSDGKWTPEALINHFVSEGFATAAITDHDRIDMVADVQRIAREREFPLLVALEMTTEWRGQTVDILCFGFEGDLTPLQKLCNAIRKAQSDNTRQVYEYLVAQGFIPEHDEDELQNVLNETTSKQPIVIVDVFIKYNPNPKDYMPLKDAGYILCANPTKDVVDAVHQCGGVALIAHPGRTDGFVTFNAGLLDEFRAEISIDGIEVYYPRHTPEQIEVYRAYANQHRWFVSAGSDSHAPDQPPIKYPAHQCAALLARLDIEVR